MLRLLFAAATSQETECDVIRRQDHWIMGLWVHLFLDIRIPFFRGGEGCAAYLAWFDFNC